MRFIGLPALFLILVSKGAFATEFPLEIIENFDSTKVVIYANESDIGKAPSWSPSEGEPPLTIANLIINVQKWVAQDSNLTDAEILKIELKPIQHHDVKLHWYYLVQLRTQTDGQSKKHYLAAVMSGKILTAIKEPSSYK